MSRLDIAQLATFCAVAELGSFNRASAVVHRSQAAVSQQIQALEGSLGQTLFRRSTRGVSLTSKGERLVGFAREILAIEDRAVAAVGEIGPQSTLRVGVPDDYAGDLLAVFIAGLRTRLPSAKIHVTCAPTPALEEAVGSGDVDIAVVTRSLDQVSDPALLRREPLVWLAPPGGTLAHQRPLPLATGHPDGIDTRAAIAALKGAGVPFEIVYESGSAASVLAAVKAGAGVAILARCAVPQDLTPAVVRSGLPRLPEVCLQVISPDTGKTGLLREAITLLEDLLIRSS